MPAIGKSNKFMGVNHRALWVSAVNKGQIYSRLKPLPQYAK